LKLIDGKCFIYLGQVEELLQEREGRVLEENVVNLDPVTVSVWTGIRPTVLLLLQQCDRSVGHGGHACAQGWLG